MTQLETKLEIIDGSMPSTDRNRDAFNSQRGRVVWLTGLSGAGKSTLATALAAALHAQGRRCFVLDGDQLRLGLSSDLGFSNADRAENMRRTAEVAKLMMDAGLLVVTALISPFQHERELARSIIGRKNFIEVYLDTPLAVCEQRDVKGLYGKARAGLIDNFTGISSAYEVPATPDLTVSGSDGTLADSAAQVLIALDRTDALERKPYP